MKQLAICGVFVLLACGRPAMGQSAATRDGGASGNAVHELADPMTACGGKDVKFHVEAAGPAATIPGLDPNAARIYLIQDLGDEPGHAACFGFGCITTRAAVDGAWLGAVQGGSWFSFTLPPGEHHMCVNWQSKVKEESAHYAFARFSVMAGYIYYYRVRLLWRTGATVRMDLELLNIDEGRYLVNTQTQSVSREEN